jgi:anti-sigma regulatory factor (Ser/Thr protein kinase)
MVITAHGNALPEAQLKNARLLVSELVTNAFQHGAGQIRLTVDSDSDGIRAQVDDEGRIERTESDGFGLRFLAKLADTWGLEQGTAKVWFTLTAAA